MNDLEKFIQQQADAFDVEKAPNTLWAGIESSLSAPRPRIRQMSYLRLAIAASLMLLMGIGIGRFTATSTMQAPTDMAQIDIPELEEAQAFYVNQIEQKSVQLRNHKQVWTAVEADLTELENRMDELKIDYSEAPPDQQEFILANMIKNYQIRMQMLEMVLEQIQSSNPTNTNNNEIDI